VFGAGEGARTPKAINRQQVPNLLRLPISPLPHIRENGPVDFSQDVLTGPLSITN
jgi:hypothetical protein